MKKEITKKLLMMADEIDKKRGLWAAEQFLNDELTVLWNQAQRGKMSFNDYREIKTEIYKTYFKKINQKGF